MSIKRATCVWETSTRKGAALLALLCLADHANDDGICWPSVDRIAWRSRVNERHARRLLRELEDCGEIWTPPGVRGRGRTPHYYVCLGFDQSVIERTLTRYYRLPGPTARRIAAEIAGRQAAALLAAQAEGLKGGLGDRFYSSKNGAGEKGTFSDKRGHSPRLKPALGVPRTIEPSLEPSYDGDGEASGENQDGEPQPPEEDPEQERWEPAGPPAIDEAAEDALLDGDWLNETLTDEEIAAAAATGALLAAGFDSQEMAKELATKDPVRIVAWCRYAQGRPHLRNAPGFIRSKLRGSAWPPSADGRRLELSDLVREEAEL